MTPSSKTFKKATIEAYDLIAPQYSARNFDHFWAEEFAYFSTHLAGKKILDIGCGAGRDGEIFVSHGFDYVGIDASRGMLAEAAKRVPNAIFKNMDFYHLEFAAASFDGFWAAASFLHVPKNEVGLVLQEAKRILKPNGLGFISVKAKVQMDEGIITEKKQGGFSRYFAFYSRGEFAQILARHGFVVVHETSKIEDDERATRWFGYFVRHADAK